MAKTRLTPLSRLLIVLAIAGGLFFGITKSGILDNLQQQGQEETDGTDTSSSSSTEGKKLKGDDVINIGVVTWGGYAGGQYFNEGFNANTNSRFYKDYGLKVNFEILDDFVASRKAFEADKVDLLWATIDAFPTEAGALAGEPQVVFQADWSRGGDAIVARRGINSVADLKGKKIAVGELTPSHSFLLWLLEAGDLTKDDVDIVYVSDAIKAGEQFKAKAVDAAVVWSPDDEACLRSVPGSRVLESTRNASSIIADVFVAKKDYINKNREKLQKLYEGWMIGAAEINSSEVAKTKAAKILAANFNGFSDADAMQAINNVRLCTHGDNVNFFGENYEYKGVKGEDLYRQMTTKYAALGFIEGTPPSWRLISRPDIVKAINLAGDKHNAEAQKTFKKVDEKEAKEVEAIATKRLSISFPSGGATLDDNAMTVIDLGFVDIAKTFSNSYIRIEGNTDNVGSKATNIALSKKRAQAVADYLIKTHGMQSDRFIIIGNGPDKPVADNNSASGRSKNRRTDFELVATE